MAITYAFTDFQSGFRRRRSTVVNLVTLETSIRDAFVGRKYLVTGSYTGFI